MTARFLSPLVVRYLDEGEWILCAPLVFSSDVLGRIVTVPEGFRTNFASVPRLPLAYLLFGGVADEAAVVHDFLYSAECSPRVPREQADDVLAEASKVCGVAAWRRGPMWFGVRLFGGSHYETVAA
jgi:hypothetical protein